MLKSALDHYERQQKLTAAALIAARRRKPSDVEGIAATTAAFQDMAAQDAAASIGPMLAEQSIEDAPLAIPNIRAIPGTASDGRSLVGLFQQARDAQQLGLMVVTQVQDAARTAAGLSIAVRPHIGFIRMLNPPSCARCVVLAGKFYRSNEGFQRHPRCDCRHVPTREDISGDLRTDPDLYFRSASPTEQLHLAGSKANLQAIHDGADLGQIVNAYRRTAGMQYAGVPSVRREFGVKVTTEGMTTRGHGYQQQRGTRQNGKTVTRVMPESIYARTAGNPAETQRLLKMYGWVTDGAAQARGRALVTADRRARAIERRAARKAASARAPKVVTREERLASLKVDPAAVDGIDLLDRPATTAEALVDSNVEMREVIGTGGNCQKCTTTYELRRRGINANASLEYAGEWFDNAFGFTYGEGRVRITKPRGKSRGDAVVEYIQNNYPVGSRGSVSGHWSDRSYGHIWNWERLDDGSVIFPDAQTGKLWDTTETNWNRLKPELTIHRIDNRRLTEIGQTRKALIPNAEYRQAVDIAKEARAVRQAARTEFDEAELAFELANPRPVRRSLADVGPEQYSADRASFIADMRDWVARKDDALAKAREKFEAASKDFELTKGKIKTGLAGK